MTKVKICGIKTVREAQIVSSFSPDYIGFVFAPTKRYIALEEAKRIKDQLKGNIETVGVFVNAPISQILSYEKAGVIDVIQLHGDEDLETVRQLKRMSKLEIMKAFRIKDGQILEENKTLLESHLLDHVLLDTYHQLAYGGTGESFDWRLLDKVKRPYFLAGGIGCDNVREAIKLRPYAIDVSSKVETGGIKDEVKLRLLFQEIEKYRS